MACSLIRTLDQDEDDPNRARVPGRILTTLPKAKELRPFVEKLVTLAKKGRAIEMEADELAPAGRARRVVTKLKNKGAADSFEINAEWKQFKESDGYAEWHAKNAPATACRRRAFSILRDKDAVEILFEELADRFMDRDGGYTRIVKLATTRLGDAGRQALIEFVGENDEKSASSSSREASLPVEDDESVDEPLAEGEDTDDETVAESDGDAVADDAVDADAEGESEEAADSEAEATDDGGESDAANDAEPEEEGDGDAEGQTDEA